jgi:hypothetical protein
LRPRCTTCNRELCRSYRGFLRSSMSGYIQICQVVAKLFANNRSDLSSGVMAGRGWRFRCSRTEPTRIKTRRPSLRASINPAAISRFPVDRLIRNVLDSSSKVIHSGAGTESIARLVQWRTDRVLRSGNNGKEVDRAQGEPHHAARLLCAPTGIWHVRQCHKRLPGMVSSCKSSTHQREKPHREQVAPDAVSSAGSHRLGGKYRIGSPTITPSPPPATANKRRLQSIVRRFTMAEPPQQKPAAGELKQVLADRRVFNKSASANGCCTQSLTAMTRQMCGRATAHQSATCCLAGVIQRSRGQLQPASVPATAWRK